MYEMFTGLEPYAAEIEQGMSKADFLYLVAHEDLRPAVPELRPDGGPYGELALADFPIGILHLMVRTRPAAAARGRGTDARRRRSAGTGTRGGGPTWTRSRNGCSRSPGPRSSGKGP